MKVVVYGPAKRTGILSGGDVVDASLACAKMLHECGGVRHALDHAAVLVPPELGRFIEGGDAALDHAEKAIDYLANRTADKLAPCGEAIVFDVAAVKLHAPRPAGARVACAGGNYADHAAAMSERGVRRGEPPVFEGEPYHAIRNLGIWGFWKVERESLGQDGLIPYPARCQRLDYEGEIAIVIGREGKDITADRLKEYVWGVTLLGDWSVRSGLEPGPLRFALQKNFDGCCSIGPCIVVGEGVDPFDTWVETIVNGERRQHFSTKDMVFTFGEYLEHLSRDLTFFPGDIISGGTAIGTAADSSPMLSDGTPSNETFLNPGDSVELRSPAIGSLRARVVSKQRI
jgi:2-keto-4-pentenoate hydratase/2-oxohepta-3-ene-1,7-dioic acid hydratase in catechol pathway